MTVTEPGWDAERGPYKYREQELVVGLPQLPLVVSKLDDLAIGHGPAEESDLLGLGRIFLDDVEKAAATVTRHVAQLRAPSGPSSPGSPDGPNRLPLDELLAGLRRLFAADYAGYFPPLGKNRLVGRVHGVGKISYGGDHDPAPNGKISYGGGGGPQPEGKISYGGGGDPLGKISYGGDTEPIAQLAESLAARAAGPGHGVRVGVLDTRLAPQPWLAGGWVARFSDLVPDGSVPPMPEGHATFITGLVLGQAPGATVEVRGVLGEDGTADSWRVAHEIVRFGRSGIDVLNLSFLCYSEDGQPPMVLTAAIDRVGPDVVVVAAAGNHGDLSSDPSDPADPATGNQNRKPAWPAALDGVIAVGVSHPDGTRAEFSPDAPWVDLQAEGVGLRSTYLMRAQTSSSDPTPVEFNGFAEWSGTSFAAALVSGAIAASTDPGRISSRDAARDIIARARGTAAPTLFSHTYAPFVRLRRFL